ncbi:MAG: choice-of-anchor B family protein [Planctomycetota bacterium]
MIKLRSKSRGPILCSFGLAALVATAQAHEEDWRKLADRGTPNFGPIITAETLAASGEGATLRAAASSATGITLLAQVPVNQFPGSSNFGNDCWGYVSPSGGEYALMGLQCGLGVVDITDPVNPVVLGTINGPCSDWRDVKTVGDYAYVVSEGGGSVQIVDLTDVDNGNISLANTFTFSGYSTTHNIIADEDSGYVYLCGANAANGGLIAIDVSNPTNPSFAGQWSQRYVHDAQVVTYTSGPYAGRQIAYCYNGGAGLEILDVTNKSNMFRVGGTSYSQIAYCHQGWVDPTGTYAYLNDELDEQTFGFGQTNSRVVDVSDISNPQLVGAYSSGFQAIDHNNYLEDGFLFQANYRSGLQVFDTNDNPTNPTLVGSFDTFPGADGNNFNGAWSAYPYFPSRNVIVSDIESGLFVFNVDAFNPPALSVALDVTPGPSLAPDTPANVEAIVNDGASTVSAVNLAYTVGEDPEQLVPMANLGAGRYAAAIPGLSCFSEVSYAVVATPAEGADVRSATLTSLVSTGQLTAFDDNFTADLGWTTIDPTGEGAGSGAWERGAPAGIGDRGDPTTDADGDGFCYLTGNAAGNTDVDDGPFVLNSPAIDVGAELKPVELQYDYWIYSTGGESLTVEASVNAGASWSTVALHTGSTAAQWTSNSVVLPPVSGTDLRVRFTVGDVPNDDITEAGVDSIVALAVECVSAPADCDADLTTDSTSNGIPDGLVTLSDFSFYLSLWSTSDPGADITLEGACTFGAGGDGVSLSDFSCYLSTWSLGCP